ncbi:MAG: EamA family transporter [Patescibacteria group bacterium]
MKHKVLIGSLAVVVAALLWSLDGTFLRPALFSIPSPLVVFLEHFLGFIALLPFLIYYRKQLKNITHKEWVAIFWVALFGGALGTTFMTKALFLTGFKDISVVILLQKLQPIFAILLAIIFLRERFPRRFYLYALIAIVGGYFVTFKDPLTFANLASVNKTTLLIPLFALLAAFSWGSSTTFGKYSIKNINYGLLAALRFGLTVLIMAGPALYFYSASIKSVTDPQWNTLLIIVVTSGAAAMWLYYYGLKKIPASLATLCELSWPVSAVIFDYYFNHNVLSLSQIIGTTLLLLAAYQAAALNKPHVITGVVIGGDGEGAKMGVPTANLYVGRAKHLPRGLYTCAVKTDHGYYRGLLYYGYNSLNKKDCLEVHLLNFNGNLYNHHLTVTTERYLRLPKKFRSVESLMKQMKQDLKLI